MELNFKEVEKFWVPDWNPRVLKDIPPPRKITRDHITNSIWLSVSDGVRLLIGSFLNRVNSKPAGGGPAFASKFACRDCVLKAADKKIVLIDGRVLVVKLQTSKKFEDPKRNF